MRTETNRKKRKFSMPDSYVILFIMLIMATILTYILPSGTFERDESASVPTVIPGSYSAVESNPIGFLDFFMLFKLGMVVVSSFIIIFLIIVCCFVNFFIMYNIYMYLTYYMPTGTFEWYESASVPTVIPGSYSAVESNPIGFLDFFMSIQSGMVAAASIIMLVLIIGGSFAIIDHSQA